MVNRDRLQVRRKDKISKLSVPWYAVRSCFARFSEKAQPPIEVESAPGNKHEFLSWTQKHQSIKATLFFQRKTGTPTLVAIRPSECKEFSRKG